MIGKRNGRNGFGGRGAFALVVALVLLALPVSAVGVLAQTPPAPAGQFVQPSQSEPQPAPAVPLQPQRSPGFLESVGRWMDESAASMNKSFGAMWQGAARNSSDAAKASTEATSSFAKGAADALGKLGTGRIAAGRERCTMSENGAPDCRQAAEQLCKNKGFAAGTSIEHETVERCPALVLLRGNKKPGECPVEHAVTKAMCQ